jgi:hypothetical protein
LSETSSQWIKYHSWFNYHILFSDRSCQFTAVCQTLLSSVLHACIGKVHKRLWKLLLHKYFLFLIFFIAYMRREDYFRLHLLFNYTCESSKTLKDSLYIWHVVKLKDMVEGNIVGSGSDFIVIQKNKKRFLVEMKIIKIQELKNATTPYGSQFW